MENRKVRRHDRIQLVLKVVVVFMLAAAFFLVIYQYDNKYTAEGPKAKNGTLVLDDDSLISSPVLFLVSGWEYYDGRLLTPEDFTDNQPVPDQYIFIGQFGGFERWSNDSSHGSASYRLNIRIPEHSDTYLLELPEIFSAYRLYINGQQAVQVGNPGPERYQPQTENRSVIIEAGGEIELLFAVSDFSHLYSGIVYPPAFGSPEAVSRLLSARLVLRSLLCAVSLTIGLLSVIVGMFRRKHLLTILFGLLCMFFVGYVSYPITQTLLTNFPGQYVIENVSFCAMLCITMLIAMQVSGLPKKWGIPFIVFGGGVCIVSMLLHLLLPFSNLQMFIAYSKLISAYEWIVAGFIIATIWYAMRKNIGHITPLLYSVVIFVCALITDRLLPLHEPILTGWFIELASFAIVLGIGVVTGQEIVAQYHDSLVMTERTNSMERLYKNQLSRFETLKQEMREVKTLHHDMRHHFTIVNEYVQTQQYKKLAEYVKEYRTSLPEDTLAEYCPIDVINILTHHYSTLARRNNISLDIRCNFTTTQIEMSDVDLCCLYSNLMENAVEACQRMRSGRRAIRIAIFRTAPDILNIRVWNTAEDARQAGEGFLSFKGSKKSGYGLLSVEAIAEKYEGAADFRWNADEKEFESKIMVMA